MICVDGYTKVLDVGRTATEGVVRTNDVIGDQELYFTCTCEGGRREGHGEDCHNCSYT